MKAHINISHDEFILIYFYNYEHFYCKHSKETALILCTLCWPISLFTNSLSNPVAISSALWLHAGQIPNNNYMIDLLTPDEFENKILKQTYIYMKIGMHEVNWFS